MTPIEATADVTPADDEPHELEQVRQELKDARDAIARMRIEIWELRDAQAGAAASERQLDYLIRDNERLRYLVRRPWRVAHMGAKQFTERASRRLLSKRTSMDAE